jgi:2,3-bisphosphoglycerate-dependent phosphoglycerate mutase
MLLIISIMYKTLLIFGLFLSSCKTTSYFVVRHAEKETAGSMSGDVPLSAAGKQRAEALKDLLLRENIKSIYATNFIRTKSTAQPLADADSLAIEIYDPRDTAFILGLRARSKGNVLIVGHSNTVDDMVNRVMGSRVIPGDLPDSQYGDLFVVKRRGKKYSFEKKHFGL